jgi:hypothetical protein
MKIRAPSQPESTVESAGSVNSSSDTAALRFNKTPVGFHFRNRRLRVLSFIAIGFALLLWATALFGLDSFQQTQMPKRDSVDFSATNEIRNASVGLFQGTSSSSHYVLPSTKEGTPSASGSWTSNGPDGGSIQSFAIDPSNSSIL